MFNGLYSHLAPSEAELAAQTLAEETQYRFPTFTTIDAVTLGLSIRKRFRGSSRHTSKGRGLVISIQTISGHTLFACTVGDLGAASSLGDVSLDAWACLEGMINVVRRTGHSSYYVEKGIGAMGKTPKDMGIRSDYMVNGGGEFFDFRNHSSTCTYRYQSISYMVTGDQVPHREYACTHTYTFRTH